MTMLLRSVWRVAGVDEVGRGPLAGAVVAAAVVLDEHRPIEGLDDSKALGAARRATLAAQIREQAAAWAIGRAEHHEIDRINILAASLLAMCRAVQALPEMPQHVLVDGIHAPCLRVRVDTRARGDGLLPAVAAASILAKVVRDTEMQALEEQHPGYGFARHKGYPTAEHLDALQRLGPCPIHRLSFAPLKRLLAARETR